MHLSRREFLGAGALAAAGAALTGIPQGQVGAGGAKTAAPGRNPIGVSTYSFWGFEGPRTPINYCIDQAAAMGFDGVELLEVQMQDTSNSALQRYKRQAFRLGLDLMGFSTHQGFVSPDKEVRQQNIDRTLRSIENAYRLGIPTMRINTEIWASSGFPS